MTSDVDILTYLDVKEGEQLDVFRCSARVCIIRDTLIGELQRVNHEINGKQYPLTDKQVFDQSYAHNLPERGIGFWGFLATAVFVGVCMLIEAFGFSVLWFIICISLAIALAVYVYSRDKIKAEKKANRSVAEYRAKREEYEENLPEWLKLRDGWKELIEKCESVLHRLAADREAIPENYWNRAGELLTYVENRQADNLKEALRVMMDQDFYKQTNKTVKQMANKMEAMKSRTELLSLQIERLDSEITRAELNNDLNTLILLSAIYDTNR